MPPALEALAAPETGEVVPRSTGWVTEDFWVRGLDLRKARVSDCLNKTMEIFCPKINMECCWWWCFVIFWIWRVVFFSQAWFCVSVDWNLPDLFALSIFLEIFMSEIQKRKKSQNMGGNCGKIPDQNLPLSIPKISCKKWSSTIKFNGDQFETSIGSSGSVQAGNIMPQIQTVKLCPNVVCCFYSKNGKTTGLFKKDLQRFGWRVKGVCFETVFIHPVKPSSFWANHCTTKPPTRRFFSRGVVYKGTDETKMATANFA